MTTFRNYGNVTIERQGALIKGLDGSEMPLTPDIIRRAFESIGLGSVLTQLAEAQKN